MGKKKLYNKRMEALVYLLVRDFVTPGDFKQVILDLKKNTGYTFKKKDSLIKYIRANLKELKNG